MQNAIYYYNQAFGFASGCAMACSSKMLSLNVLRLHNYVAKCNLGLVNLRLMCPVVLTVQGLQGGCRGVHCHVLAGEL